MAVGVHASLKAPGLSSEAHGPAALLLAVPVFPHAATPCTDPRKQFSPCFQAPGGVPARNPLPLVVLFAGGFGPSELLFSERQTPGNGLFSELHGVLSKWDPQDGLGLHPLTRSTRFG